MSASRAGASTARLADVAIAMFTLIASACGPVLPQASTKTPANAQPDWEASPQASEGASTGSTDDRLESGGLRNLEPAPDDSEPLVSQRAMSRIQFNAPLVCAAPSIADDPGAGCPELERADQIGELDQLTPEALTERAMDARRHCPALAVVLMRRALDDLYGLAHARASIDLAFVEVRYLGNRAPEIAALARAGADEALALGEHCVYLSGLVELARFYLRQSRTDEAGLVIEEALESREQCEAPRWLGRLWFYDSELHRQKGEQLRQYESLAKALAPWPSGTREYLYYSELIAQLRHDLGDVSDEGERFVTLLREAVARGHADIALNLRFDLSGLYRDLGQYDQAVAVLEEACDGVQGVPEVVQRAPDISVAKAAILVDAGEYEPARAILDAVPLETFSTSVARLRDRWLLTHGRLLLEEGDPDNAGNVLSALVDGADVEPEIQWRARLGLARVERAMGRETEARSVLWGAVDLLEQQRAETREVFWSMAHSSQREWLYREWLDALAAAWEDGGREPSSSGGSGTRTAPANEAVEGAEASRWAPERSFVAGPVTADDLLAAVEKLSSQAFNEELFRDRGGVPGVVASRASGGPWRELPDAWVSGAELREALPAGMPVIVYTPLGERFLILEVRREAVQVHLVPVDTASLSRSLAALRDGARDRRRLSISVLDELGAELLAPVWDQLPDDGPVGFVMSGSLESLPLAALRVRGQYLVERCAPFELPNLRSVGSLRHRAPPVGTLTALAVGYGDDLPLVAREVSLLDRPGIEVTTLVGDAATVQSVREAMPGRDVIHFAMHSAPPDPVRDDRDRVVRIEAGAVSLHGGKLTVNQVQAQRLVARLVTLSGCRTRVGRAGFMEHGYGALHRAMLVAGAESVIASRWSVGDETTYELMARVYDAYPGLPRAAALARAQREMISSRGMTTSLTRRPAGSHLVYDPTVSLETASEAIPYAAPWSWAAFTLVGRWD